jgi:3-dehydroquinate synthetase
LEASSNFEIAHGVAVALGILTANYYANVVGRLNEAGQIRANQLNAYLVRLLKPIEDALKQSLLKIDFKVVLAKFEGDKKHRQDLYRMVIPHQGGDLMLTSTPKNEDSRSIISRRLL